MPYERNYAVGAECAPDHGQIVQIDNLSTTNVTYGFLSFSEPTSRSPEDQSRFKRNVSMCMRMDISHSSIPEYQVTIDWESVGFLSDSLLGGS